MTCSVYYFAICCIAKADNRIYLPTIVACSSKMNPVLIKIADTFQYVMAIGITVIYCQSTSTKVFLLNL